MSTPYLAGTFARWNLDEPDVKAYADDQYGEEDWQLFDFLRKLGLSYPLDDGNATGTAYRFHPDREDGATSPYRCVDSAITC